MVLVVVFKSPVRVDSVEAVQALSSALADASTMANDGTMAITERTELGGLSMRQSLRKLRRLSIGRRPQLHLTQRCFATQGRQNISLTSLDEELHRSMKHMPLQSPMSLMQRRAAFIAVTVLTSTLFLLSNLVPWKQYPPSGLGVFIAQEPDPISLITLPKVTGSRSERIPRSMPQTVLRRHVTGMISQLNRYISSPDIILQNGPFWTTYICTMGPS